MKRSAWQSLFNSHPRLTLVDLATVTGKPYRSVAGWAHKLGIKVPDGRSVRYTMAARRKHWLVNWQEVDWTAGTDTELARKFGCSRQLVGKRRREFAVGGK